MPESERYVYGSAAEIPAALPQRRAKQDSFRKARARNEAARREQENALSMDLPYLILLTAAAIAALFILVSYLQVQSSITASIKNIEAQERLLETLKNDNDSLESRINASIDLDHVYQVATQELGMIYAHKNQVIRYNRTESEYVKQYEDIPE